MDTPLPYLPKPPHRDGSVSITFSVVSNQIISGDLHAFSIKALRVPMGTAAFKCVKSSNMEAVSSITFIQSAIPLTRIVD